MTELLHEIFTGKRRMLPPGIMDAIWANTLHEIHAGELHVNNLYPETYSNTHFVGAYTLLHVACAFGAVQAVQDLLVANADSNLQCRDTGYVAMHFAVGFCRFPAPTPARIAICQMLPQKQWAAVTTFEKNTPLFIMWNGCDPDLFQWVIQQPRCDLSATNRTKQTVLDRLLRSGLSYDQKRLFVDMVLAEVAARKQWTPARAAWVVACVK